MLKIAITITTLALSTPSWAFEMNPECAAAGFRPGHGGNGVGCTCALSLGGYIRPMRGWATRNQFVLRNIFMDQFVACRRKGSLELGLKGNADTPPKDRRLSGDP
jgi:hypothetical protein